MNPKIIIPIHLENVKDCIFKLYYGNYYVIGMGSNLEYQIKTIQGDIERYISGARSSRDISRLYSIFCNIIRELPDREFKIEILMKDGKPYQLLKRCQTELDEALSDRNCLNTLFIPFLSSRIQTPPIYLKFKAKTPHWINRGIYLNFRKWQYSRWVI